MSNRPGNERQTVAVVGFPNVGKSTLVNRLAGGREAVTDAQPGVTRDRKRIECEWNGRRFDLLDTGGVDLADQAELAGEIQRQAQTGMAEADVILLVADGRSGPGAGDTELAQALRRAEAPVIVAVNKVDRPGDQHLTAEFHGLGLGEPLAVSATHGLGTGDLLDRVVEALGEAPTGDADSDLVRVAVIGRPNAGKSSLVNALVGSERVIVSETPGTTRDSIDTRLFVDDREVLLVDTAGLRRRAKVAGTVDYYAQIRSEQAAARADVAVVVCDAAEGVTAEDLKVVDLAMKSGCSTLIALNKWDITGTDVDDARARLRRKSRLRPEAVTCSARNGRNVANILGKAISLADRAEQRIPTPQLNRFLADVVATTPPPSRRGKRLRLYYAAQIGTSPPRYAIQVNDRRLLTRDWAYHFENRLREAYGLQGIPLIIDFVPRTRRDLSSGGRSD